MGRMMLAGRTALVTGAGGGIGREITLALARAGADVILAGRSIDAMAAVADEVRAIGQKSEVVSMDVTAPDSVNAAVESALRHVGAIDILVCNSGISGPAAPVWEYPVDAWRHVQDVNLTGVFLTCRALLPHMVERGSGTVVVIGSIAGKRPSPNRSGYSSSKAGLVALVRTIALDGGPYGIRANLVSPGGVAGANLDNIIQQNVDATGADAETVRASYRDAAPLRRLVEPGDVADAVVYLASDAATNVTGADLNVTAGLVMH
ncbi:SDR family NAD(P)-dependent oxidoreductase [Microbispora sp. NBRC 16548]|uniref:SDR family NAD(P)-dependent oxidoreductase n=1 Tax=Microbispora sp. NBRC 16548 TaxID=3030994 RepID=UPI0024A491F8|nr:SDR family NAD(P)-dependent oxidoreductase [Microbispora sp. NBRC 16548]GLX11122.1 oxidoreductase [Microbispora sp. NBRC 16548]